MTKDCTQKFMLSPTRRNLLGSGVAVGLMAGATGLAGISDMAWAQRSVPMAELLAPGPLSEIELGNKDAKVTVVEYASTVCPHCASFHGKVFPDLKKDYIDTGKIRFIIRPYAGHPIDIAAYMLVYCLDSSEKRTALLSLLFRRQNYWAVRDTSVGAQRLFELSKQAGFTKESFEKCLGDEKRHDAVKSIGVKAEKVFKVSGTPYFFINGKPLRNSSIDEFKKAIDPLLQ